MNYIERLARDLLNDSQVESDRNKLPVTKESVLEYDPDWIEFRDIPNKGLCGIKRMAFTVGLCYNLNNNIVSANYEGRYCFHTKAQALEALNTWDGTGDPPGNWIKHKGNTEYSNPNYEKEG